ncbi:MAG: hypothetical protein ACRDZQ_13125 [Acidimicrobiales bacterium]
MAAAIRSTGFSPALNYGDRPPACVGVALGSAPSDAIYASFLATGIGAAAPPVEEVGLESRDGGASWRPIPTPAGVTVLDFGAFETVGVSVTAEFNTGKASRPQPVVEVASGADRWKTARLACPAVGPCLRFSAFLEGSCGVNGEYTQVLTSPDGGATWHRSTGPLGGVHACFQPELVAVSASEELFVEAGSVYPVQVSRDGGRSWADIGLPPVPGANPPTPSGGSSLSAGPPPPLEMYGNYLQLLPDGALLLSSSEQGQSWELLAPGVGAWCRPATSPGGVNPAYLDGVPTVVGPTLWWLSTPTVKGAGEQAHHAALASPSC